MASVTRISLARQGSAVPCSSPVGWQFGVVGADAPSSTPSHPPMSAAKPYITFTEQRATQCQQLTHANLSSEAADKNSAGNRRVTLGSLSEGLCLFQGQVGNAHGVLSRVDTTESGRK